MLRRSGRWQSRVFLSVLLGGLLMHPFALAQVSQPTKRGDSGVHVLRLQRALAKRGMLSGGISGQYDDLTIKAVERYQRLRGLPLSGSADLPTLQALFPEEARAAKGPQLEQHSRTARTIPRPSGQGQQGSHVLALQKALMSRGYDAGMLDGTYCADTAQAVAAYQRDRGLLVTGRADEETLRVLLTKQPPGLGETTRPSWYGGAGELIPLGAIFRIQDVRTGLTYSAMRVHGTSHLDAEPLTPWDTHTMLSVYDGVWKWDRRPILLNYRGRVYAASMNGKPHGWEILPGNNMSGHFCVHFFGSRGDGSQRVDPNHLRCAVEASFADWQ